MSENGSPWQGYYLTAYGIAVKHGFPGTETEWLESLKGTPGIAATAAEMTNKGKIYVYEIGRAHV